MPRTRVPERLEKRAREIVEALDGTWSRSRGMCCCPAHDDQTPSLSVTIGVRAILFHCFAGCSNEAVLASLGRIGVKAAELFDGRGEPIAPWTSAETLLRGMVAARSAASSTVFGRFILVVTSGFLRCEEVDAVLKLVGGHHAVADRNRAALGGVPQHNRRRDLGLEPHTAALVGLDCVIWEMA